MKSIEQLLVDDARAPLEDAGFSARVMGALPPPAPRMAWWWKPALILGSATLGSVLAAAFGPAGASLAQGAIDLATAHYLTPGALSLLGSALTLAVVGAVLAADE
jgi:hypothetical protein